MEDNVHPMRSSANIVIHQFYASRFILQGDELTITIFRIDPSRQKTALPSKEVAPSMLFHPEKKKFSIL